MHKHVTFSKVAIMSLFAAVLMTAGSVQGFARERNETIDATALGTSTQVGAVIGITLQIYRYSTPAEQKVLIDAFMQGQNQGLANALQKMKAVGHIAITGTLGYDVSYVRMIPTETGRTLIFVTNRKIRFGEAWTDSPTISYDLTAGQIEINEHDKSKSTGSLFPAAQLILNSEGKLSLELNQNPWRLVDIIDWPGTPSEN